MFSKYIFSRRSGTTIIFAALISAGTLFPGGLRANVPEPFNVSMANVPTVIFKILGNKLLFTTGGSFQTHLYVTEGTPETTSLLKTGRFAISDAVELNNQLFFYAADDSLLVLEGGSGFELWKTDGTADGTVIAKDIFPGEDLTMDYGDFVGIGPIGIYMAGSSNPTNFFS